MKTLNIDNLAYSAPTLSFDLTVNIDGNTSVTSISGDYSTLDCYVDAQTEQFCAITLNGSTVEVSQNQYSAISFDGVEMTTAYQLGTSFELKVGSLVNGGGGSPTVFADMGNTAFVSSGGNDTTGTVGNINKPYLTVNAAIADLNPSVEATVIILSGTTQFQVADYDYTAMPTFINLIDYSGQGFQFTGSCSFGTLRLQTGGPVDITTTMLFTGTQQVNIKCDVFTILPATTGSVALNIIDSIIECNDFVTDTNTFDPSLEFDVIDWKKSITLNEPITYNQCNPKEYIATLIQSGTNAPVATVVKNTLGQAVTWGYDAPGTYTATTAGAFTLNRSTSVPQLKSWQLSGLWYQIIINPEDSDFFYIITQEDGLNVNGVLTGPYGVPFPIKIEVYP